MLQHTTRITMTKLKRTTKEKEKMVNATCAENLVILKKNAGEIKRVITKRRIDITIKVEN